MQLTQPDAELPAMKPNSATQVAQYKDSHTEQAAGILHFT
ncbi:hypothetical protein SOHN41_00915 [Shewanella sp. HN-41]|nr:hypothetical protein SOHN41_00915 [Shewanella sp. HN-41]